MKKKKEFFRIRKDRKRKNGANARACVRSQRPFAAFKITTEKNPVDRFFIPTLVLFSKQRWKARVLFSSIRADVVLFSKQKARSPYACARVCICTQPHPPPTSENSQQMRVCPFQALQGTYKPFYGRDR